MRIIKFRAWDKKNKRWLDINEIVSDWSGTPWLDAMCVSGHTEFELRDSSGDLEWVQYTGLTDKNGKEIYEGDVVRQIDGGVQVTEPIIVTWHDHGWLPSITHLTVIIGNIYENPELVNVE